MLLNILGGLIGLAIGMAIVWTGFWLGNRSHQKDMARITTNRYRGEFINAGPESDPAMISHLNGLPWHDAPTPKKNHACEPQTVGWINMFTYYQRCACGAVNRDYAGWIERNSRKSSD